MRKYENFTGSFIYFIGPQIGHVSVLRMITNMGNRIGTNGLKSVIIHFLEMGTLPIEQN
jgi:hypothetical protein